MSGHKGFLIPRRILAVGIIVSIRHMHTSGNAGYEYQRGRGDTINVAIAYSPMSLYRYADTLGGFNYEMLRDMGHMYGDKFKFYPVASVSESLDELSRGKYDILVADIQCARLHRQDGARESRHHHHITATACGSVSMGRGRRAVGRTS